jgi:hypothetical protein
MPPSPGGISGLMIFGFSSLRGFQQLARRVGLQNIDSRNLGCKISKLKHLAGRCGARLLMPAASGITHISGISPGGVKVHSGEVRSSLYLLALRRRRKKKGLTRFKACSAHHTLSCTALNRTLAMSQIPLSGQRRKAFSSVWLARMLRRRYASALVESLYRRVSGHEQLET